MSMTKQEIFDTVAKHLFSQGQRSVNANGVCLYRGPNGLKCAIGALITDEEYDSEMEFKTISFLKERFIPDRLKGVIIDFLSDLQNIHDDYANWSRTSQMKEELEIVARNFGLDYSILKDLFF